MNYIFVAEKQEAKYIDKTFPNTEIVVTGVGVYNVIKALHDFENSHIFTSDDKFFNVGFCGSNLELKNKGTDIGYVYTVATSSLETETKYVKFPDIKLTKTKDKITCYSADDFVHQTKHKGIFDMELYTLATYFKGKIKSFKVVSDNLNLKHYKKNIKNLKESWVVVNMLLAKELV